MAVTVLVLITLASNLLSIINSPTFQYVRKKVGSIVEAMAELKKLKSTIETIHAVLADAEKKQEGSDSVRNWIEKVTDVLYDAEDLFDEVAFADLLEQQTEGPELRKKGTLALFSSKLNLNPVASKNSIAKKVKAIRKRFLDISKDMEGFKFEVCLNRDEPRWDMRKGQDPGYFIVPNEVFGRDQDKETILNMLFRDSKPSKNVPVIAIVGIGGMGKTTLAQLVYNDEEVQNRFENKWFACISDTSDDEQVLERIFQSISGNKDNNFTMSQLQTEIRKLIEGNNFLLVLDDVWDDDRGRWIDRMNLFSGGAEGSKIIVTARSSSVAMAMETSQVHNLEGLSEKAAWALFKRVALSKKESWDPRRIDLGREIVKKCANVPLAIKFIGSLLNKKQSIQEWESFRNVELAKLGESGPDNVVSVLKISYDHLPSKLKHCFAYCSLFPKGFEFESNKLIYLWRAQGYIEPDHDQSQTLEQVGYLYLMDLLRMCFFQQATSYSYGVVASCKMHDLVHDLAQHVAGEEFVMLKRPSYQFSNCPRHLGVGWKSDKSWEALPPNHNINRLRSFFLMTGGSHLLSPLDQQFTKFKRLRALSLQNLQIENVSDSVGELKHLRYLDLSHNTFNSLPASMTNLLNLIALDIGGCYNLQLLPDSFANLVNLRHLNILGCDLLKHMPPEFRKLVSLHYLSNFNVGKAINGVRRSGLDALSGLELRGMLMIKFDSDIVEWDGDESWQLPVSPENLHIMCYPGVRIPRWANESANELSHLELKYCVKVKNLPPFSCLPYLKFLSLDGLCELEYIENEGVTNSFFCSLKQLEMKNLPRLKGWWRNVAAATPTPEFPRLSQLKIEGCPELNSMPLSPFVCKLELDDITDGEVIQQLLSHSQLEEISISNSTGLTSFQNVSLTSLRHINIDRCCRLEDLHVAAPHLKTVLIKECDRLVSFRVAALTSLSSLKVYYCKRLRISHIGHPNIVEDLDISGCPKLRMLEGENSGVDWNSLRSLCKLTVDKLPPAEMLPNGLRRLQALGELQIIEREINLSSDSDSESSTSSEQEA